MTVCLDRDGHLVSPSCMARLRMLGMLDDANRERAVDIIDRLHWVVSAVRACLRRRAAFCGALMQPRPDFAHDRFVRQGNRAMG